MSTANPSTRRRCAALAALKIRWRTRVCGSGDKDESANHVDPHERDQQLYVIDWLRWQAKARSIPLLCVDSNKWDRVNPMFF